MNGSERERPSFFPLQSPPLTRFLYGFGFPDWKNSYGWLANIGDQKKTDTKMVRLLSNFVSHHLHSLHKEV